MDQSHVMVRMCSNESLVNRCLSVVVNIYKIGKLNPVDLKTLPKNLNIILLNVFSKRGYLNDDNIDIFLKENTKVLELSECDKIGDVSIEKISNKCKYLIKIDLNSNMIPRSLITSKSISYLAQNCRYLQTILLRRCVLVDDECIESIVRNCPKLTSLNIANCPLITDKALQSLGEGCSFLKSINFSGTQTTDNGIFSLFSTDKISNTIEEIHMTNCRLVTDQSIEIILMSCKKMKYLLFHCCPNITDASRIALEDYMTNNSNQKVKHLTWSIY